LAALIFCSFAWAVLTRATRALRAFVAAALEPALLTRDFLTEGVETFLSFAEVMFLALSLEWRASFSFALAFAIDAALPRAFARKVFV
jgi:hypothetical protein